jgi:hypothetical protein
MLDVGTSVYVFGYVVFGLVTSEFLGTKLYKNYAKYVLSQRVLIIFLDVLFYFLIGYKGILLGYVLSFLPYFKPIIDSFKYSTFDLSQIKNNFKFIFINYLIDLGKILHDHIDKLLIVSLFGFALLENYHLGYQIIIVLGILPAAIFQYVLPR